jgi:hypothetical protein
MNYGFDGKRFYIDYESCKRPVGNMREESDRRAVEVYETSETKKLILSLSSGIDSQSVLHSFHQQGIPLETVFMHTPGYNDNEFLNIQRIDAKYGVKTQVIEIDPVAIKQELEEEAAVTGIHVYSLLFKRFLQQVPKDYDFIQMTHDPYVHISPRKIFYWFMGYNSPEILRDRAFKMVERTGRTIFYGDTPEFTLSIIDDSIFSAALYSARYFSENGLTKPGVKLDSLDRWDYYVKPLLYGKYWKDELIYFPKYVGFEQLDWLSGPSGIRNHGVTIPYHDFIKFLKQPPGNVKRFYENVDPTPPKKE